MKLFQLIFMLCSMAFGFDARLYFWILDFIKTKLEWILTKYLWTGLTKNMKIKWMSIDGINYWYLIPIILCFIIYLYILFMWTVYYIILMKVPIGFMKKFMKYEE